MGTKSVVRKKIKPNNTFYEEIDVYHTTKRFELKTIYVTL